MRPTSRSSLATPVQFPLCNASMTRRWTHAPEAVSSAIRRSAYSSEEEAPRWQSVLDTAKHGYGHYMPIFRFTGCPEQVGISSRPVKIPDRWWLFFFPATSGDFVGTNANGQSVNRWFYPRSTGLQRLPAGRLIHFVRFAEDDSTRWEIVDSQDRIASGSMPGAYELWGVHPATGALIATRLIDRTHSVPVLLEVRVRR